MRFLDLISKTLKHEDGPMHLPDLAIYAGNR